jgi:hypothetical protein
MSLVLGDDEAMQPSIMQLGHVGPRLIYEGRLKSSWTHLTTPSRNFVEVR